MKKIIIKASPERPFSFTVVDSDKPCYTTFAAYPKATEEIANLFAANPDVGEVDIYGPKDYTKRVRTEFAAHTGIPVKVIGA